MADQPLPVYLGRGFFYFDQVRAVLHNEEVLNNPCQNLGSYKNIAPMGAIFL
jgi:hypothetical protein